MIYLLYHKLVGMHNPCAGLEDPFLSCSELGLLIPAFGCQRLGHRSLECNKVCMVGIGLGQLGVPLCFEESGYECCQVQTPWHCYRCKHCGHWCLREVGARVGGWGGGPAVPSTVLPGLSAFFLPRWPAK